MKALKLFRKINTLPDWARLMRLSTRPAGAQRQFWVWCLSLDQDEGCSRFAFHSIYHSCGAKSMRNPRMSCSVRSMECLDSWNNWLDWSAVYNGITMSYLFNNSPIKQHGTYHRPIKKQFIYCLSPIRCRYYLASCMRVKQQCQIAHPKKVYSVFELSSHWGV